MDEVGLRPTESVAGGHGDPPRVPDYFNKPVAMAMAMTTPITDSPVMPPAASDVSDS